jgi:chitinase
MLKHRFLFAAFLAIAPGLTTSAVAQSTTSAPKAIVGYVFPQEKTLQPGEINPKILTRINYAFSNIANGRMVDGFKTDKVNLAYLCALRKVNPNLTVLVSVGGWLWSGGFSDVSLTHESRTVFIQSAMDYLTAYDLDGLDIDWEYPGLEGATKAFRPEDKENFTSLVQELRARFDAETLKTHRRLYLTMAAGSSNEFITHTEMDKVQLYLDTVNLMAYDYYEPEGGSNTGHHSPLYANPADPKRASSDASVKAFEAAGVPAAKIVLGVPFYGHEWGQVGATSHGLYQPGRQIPDAYAPYHLIVDSMLGKGYVRYWDKDAAVPYLYSPTKHIFVSYEDPQSLKGKCEYVLHNDLGGVMFWDYGGDDPANHLLTTIHSALYPAVAPRGGKQ